MFGTENAAVTRAANPSGQEERSAYISIQLCGGTVTGSRMNRLNRHSSLRGHTVCPVNRCKEDNRVVKLKWENSGRAQTAGSGQDRVLMISDTQNHWVPGLCPPLANLNSYRTRRFGNWICFRPQVRGRRHLFCWVPHKEQTSIPQQTMSYN
jgi:hypothetical protein